MATESCNLGGRESASGGHDEADNACGFVEALVSAALGVDTGELRARSRGRARAAFARQMAMYLAHVHFGLNLSQVGHRFGRDRTTVAHACARIEDRRDDPGFERLLAFLEAAIDRWRMRIRCYGDLR